MMPRPPLPRTRFTQMSVIFDDSAVLVRVEFWWTRRLIGRFEGEIGEIAL